ncbi:MAG: hypothetical protein ACE14T_11915 [Syntrophales bacterium]
MANGASGPEIRELVTKITIRYFKNGQVTLEAPMDDKILCYGLLEMAKQIIANHEIKKSDILIPEPVIDPNRLRGN